MSEVTAAEISRLAGVTRATVSNWRRRHADFPAPTGGTDANPTYTLAEVEPWLENRGYLTDPDPAAELRGAVRGNVTLVTTLLRAMARSVEPDVPPAVAEALTECVAAVGAAEAIEVLAAALPSDPATPPAVAELMAAFLPSPTRVLDPGCGGGGLLLAAARAGAKKLFGQELSKFQSALAEARLWTQGADADIRPGDCLRSDAFDDLMADAVLCNPPYGDRDWGHDDLGYDPRWAYGLPPRGESELAWVQHCLAHLEPGGTAVLLMPPGAAFRPSGRRIRTELVRSGALRAVVSLPPKSAPPMHIRLQVWVLQRADPGDVLFVDVADGPLDVAVEHWHAFVEDPEDFGTVDGVARARPVADLLDDAVDLTPARHVGSAPVTGEPDRHAAGPEQLRGMLRRAGHALIAAGGGSAWSPAGAERLTWRTAGLADLLRGGAVTLHRAGDTVQVLPGDVVLRELVRGRERTPVPTASVAEATGPLAQHHLLLRPDPERLDPWFLAGFLSAEENLNGATTGSTIERIDVKRLRVPLLPLDEQRRYGLAFRRLHALRRSADLASRLADQLSHDVAVGLTAGTLLPPHSPEGNR